MEKKLMSKLRVKETMQVGNQFIYGIKNYEFIDYDGYMSQYNPFNDEDLRPKDQWFIHIRYKNANKTVHITEEMLSDCDYIGMEIKNMYNEAKEFYYKKK